METRLKSVFVKSALVWQKRSIMKTLGIVRETKNKWERRVPLNPSAVNELIRKGFEVIVQPSDIRIFKNEEYRAGGAKLSEDLSRCDFIIGVKEIPIDDIIPGKAYLFFFTCYKRTGLQYAASAEDIG